MKTIAILASGPRDLNRCRWIELFNNKPCITHVINNCKINDNIKISVIINEKNFELNNFLIKNHKDVIIIKTNNISMITSFEAAFNQDENDTLIVAGDLWNLKKKNVIKFLESEYESAIYRVKVPWGNNIESYDKSLFKRSDIGCSIFLISNNEQKIFLSDKNINNAKYYFKMFYPNEKTDINRSYIWTWLIYAYFFEISSSKNNKNEINSKKGTIYIDTLIYNDND